ncbi:MAG: hypothetical protein IT428_25185 [Planctomycetaceae bacterium]|nr:hypothetical protein [Planctomycetaceae bacterium]
MHSSDTPPRPSHIFLDMDGVLVDFISAAVRLHGHGHRLAEWPTGIWEDHSVLGLTPADFWGPIETHGAKFWAELEPYPWALELYEQLREIAPVTIASSPNQDPHCLEGKVQWLQKRFGRRFRDFLIGPPKHLMARPGTVLVDDSPRMIREFNAAGGRGILFPQPWNDNHPHRQDPLAYVFKQLERRTGMPAPSAVEKDAAS